MRAPRPRPSRVSDAGEMGSLNPGRPPFVRGGMSDMGARAAACISGSGWMSVPPPSGLFTFLMRMGIFLRMTYRASGVNVNQTRGGSRGVNGC